MKDLDKTIDFSNNKPDESPDKVQHKSSDEITERLSPFGQEISENENRVIRNNLNYEQDESPHNYCPSCGCSNKPNAQFCKNCGSKLDTLSDKSTESYQREPIIDNYSEFSSDVNDYRRLGGFLKFYIYAVVVLNSLSILQTIIGLFVIIIYAKEFYLTGYEEDISFYFISFIPNIALSTFDIWWAFQIKKRNPRFLAYYDTIHILLRVILALVVSFSAGFIILILAAISTAIATVIVNLYFIMSKRVRGYFGSDDFIRINPFTRFLVK